VPYAHPVLAAVVAALLFAVANVVQRRAAAAVPRSTGGAVQLGRRLVRSPRWLLGSGFAVGGLLLQTVALAGGSLVVVQSVLVSGVVVAVILDAGGDRRRPTWPEIAGPVLVVGGVVLLVVSGPSAGGEAGLGQSVAGLLAVGVVGGGALLAARRIRAGDRTARLLGGAAGTCFALDALFLKELVSGLGGGRADVVVVGVVGFALASVLGNLTLHRGYQLAPLRVVLPTLTGAEPVAAFLLGWVVLQEGLPGGWLGHLAAVLGVVAAVTGNAVVALAEVPAPRAERVEEPVPESIAA
jgi:drug/metabolite transporter (DMT)-like permease